MFLEKRGTVLVIGAGAAGLIAARSLLRRKKKVVVLEARELPGGRIRTISLPSFDVPLELGAEFVHGQAPLTSELLREYRIGKTKVGGTILRLKENRLQKSDFLEGNERYLRRRLRKLDRDLSMDEFLRRYFSEEKYREQGEELRKFVEGYDAADPVRASAKAFRSEWESQGRQYRVEGGYSRLIEALYEDCRKAGGEFYFSSAVQSVRWHEGTVEATLPNGKIFTAAQAIITIPLGLLRSDSGPGAIRFDPPLPMIHEAARQSGFGSVVKIFLQFCTPFWKERPMIKRFGRKVKSAGFLFADAPVPTWWTQYPEESGLLTGWIGGLPAERWSAAGEQAVLAQALETLSLLFREDAETLSSMLTAWKVADWFADPFARGAYSFKVVGGDSLQRFLRRPVADTLFFGGEALALQDTGTVEAALASGLSAASRIA